MSILTNLSDLPTTHNGNPIPADELVAAIKYLDAIMGVAPFDVRWTTDKKKQTRAAYRGHDIIATGEGTAVLGSEYKDLPQNKDKDTGSLPYGIWMLYPYLILTDTGHIQARLHVVKSTVRTTYTVDGVEAVDGKMPDGTKVRDMLYSRKPNEDAVLVFNVPVTRLTLL